MKKRICIFGDSVTWGTGLEKREGWADLFRSYIEEKSKHAVEVYNLGIDGDSSKDLLIRLDVEAQARKPNLVMIAIGVNDSVYRENNTDASSADEYTANLEVIYKKAQKYTEKIWFVGLVKGSDAETIPLKASSTGKCYSKKAVRIYDNCLRDFAASKKVPFVDVYTELDDSDFDDGLHPNIKGHLKIFNKVKRMFEEKNILNLL